MGNLTGTVTIFEPLRRVPAFNLFPRPLREVSPLINSSRVLAERIQDLPGQTQISVGMPSLVIKEQAIEGSQYLARSFHNAGVRQMVLSPGNEACSISCADIMDIHFAVSSGSLNKTEQRLGSLGLALKVEGLPVRWNDFYRQFYPGTALRVPPYFAAPQSVVGAYSDLKLFINDPASHERAARALELLAQVRKPGLLRQFLSGIPSAGLGMLAGEAIGLCDKNIFGLPIIEAIANFALTPFDSIYNLAMHSVPLTVQTQYRIAADIDVPFGKKMDLFETFVLISPLAVIELAGSSEAAAKQTARLLNSYYLSYQGDNVPDLSAVSLLPLRSLRIDEILGVLNQKRAETRMEILDEIAASYPALFTCLLNAGMAVLPKAEE